MLKSECLDRDEQEARRPLSDKKKPRQSMGGDDTRFMFTKGNGIKNLQTSV